MRNCVLSRLNNAVSADDGQYLRIESQGSRATRKGEKIFIMDFQGRKEGRKASM